MNVKYLSDQKGQITAVQVSIEDWERLKLIHPDISEMDTPLPQWQTDLLDKRLENIRNHPEYVKPINGLMEMLHRDID